MRFPFGKSNKTSDETDPSREDEQNREDKKSFAEKIGHFFNPEPQKEKVLRHEDFHAAGDVYYATVSACYKIAQRVFCLVLAAVLLISVTANYKDITYDNFFYLFKDFSSAVDADSTGYETLSYDSDTRHRFSLYRGGLSVVNPSSVSAFSATGRRTLRQTSDFSSPFVVSSDQYMLVYDMTGTRFSIYNSFAKVYTESKEYPITDACFGEDNSFVVVSRSDLSEAVVYSYGKNFKPQGEIRYGYYLFDVALDVENHRMATVGYDNGDGTGRTFISLRDYPFVKKEDSSVYRDVELMGEFPLACGFLEDRRLAVITDSAVHILDENLNKIETIGYSQKTVRGFCVNSYGVAVSTVYASQNEIIAFDQKGTLLYQDSVVSNISEVGIYETYLFLKTEAGVIRLKADTGEEAMLTSGSGKLLVYDSKTALVCGDAKAEYLIFE